MDYILDNPWSLTLGTQYFDLERELKVREILGLSVRARHKEVREAMHKWIEEYSERSI